MFRWFRQTQDPDPLASLRAHGLQLIDLNERWGAVCLKQANRLEGVHVRDPERLDAEIRSWNRQIRWGYPVPREPVQARMCSAIGRTDPTTWALVRTTTEIALHHKSAEEASWDAHTTNDRLDAAWEGLEQLGIKVWGCLGTDESDAVRLLQSGAVPVGGAEGVAFFSEAEVERAVRGEGLDIRCSGLVHPGPRLVPQVSVARTVLRLLELAGLPVAWSGRPLDPVRIPPFRWRKRLHGSTGTFPPAVSRADSDR